MNYGGKLIEIQTRTLLQHAWAEVSEKVSDEIDPSIKYGGGDAEIQQTLREISKFITDEESAEKRIMNALALLPSDKLSADQQQEIENMLEKLNEGRQRLYKYSRVIINNLVKLKENSNDLSD
ncbi:MAG TPA: hypothetical protein VHU19_08790 [Pyrinomonadaceae bacterium]|nr:hypothetical protein [Pyrinomonadaceae bacterium]